MTAPLLALAGGLGALARVEIGLALAARHPFQPWGTRVVNLVGAAALAALLIATDDPDVRAVVGTGFLGGFTTFSTWMVDATEDRGRAALLAEVVLPLTVGVVLVVAVRSVLG